MSEAEDTSTDGGNSLSSGTLLGLPPAELAKKIFADNKPKAPRAEELIGTKLIGRYIVESIVGRGGMATVFAGRHLTINKPVAIKVLDPALLVPDAVERFLQEAQATSLVRHENVIEVTDFGSTEDGVVFSVMELLTGESLYETLESEGALPPERAVNIMSQICAGLHAAHEQGIIHRDLKPENCFRAPRTSNADFIKVLDFGVAKVTDTDNTVVTAAPRQTRVGVIVGTPEFVAPEQARGETCDPRTDVYAAGVMLYLLLSGELPYTKPTAAELLAQHMYDPIPQLTDTRPNVPKQLSDAVATAMAKDPDDRYASMAEMSAAIQASIASIRRMSSAHTALIDTHDIQPPARSRSWIWLALVALLLLGLGGGYWAFSNGGASATREGDSAASAAESVHSAQPNEGKAVDGKPPVRAASVTPPTPQPEEPEPEPEPEPVVAAPDEAEAEPSGDEEPAADDPQAEDEEPSKRASRKRRRKNRSKKPSSDEPKNKLTPEPKPASKPTLDDTAKISEVKNPFGD